MLKWKAWGKVVGPSLPDQVMNVGDVRIGPIEAEAYPQRLPKRRIHFSQYPNHIHVDLATVDISSDCWILLGGIEADDADAALYKARHDVVPLIVAALSATVASDPFHVEILGIEGTKRRQGNYEYSGAESFEYFEPEVLSRDHAATALGRWRRLFEADGPLRTAAHALARGVRASETATGIEGTSASLLAYFQVIEACVNIAPWSAPPELEAEQQAVLRALGEALVSDRATARHVAAVLAASDSLKRLKNSFLDLRIKHAAETFGLSDEWIEGARALKKTRDQELGHNKGVPNEQILEAWQHTGGSRTSAYMLAMTMLRAATQYHHHLAPRA